LAVGADYQLGGFGGVVVRTGSHRRDVLFNEVCQGVGHHDDGHLGDAELLYQYEQSG